MTMGNIHLVTGFAGQEHIRAIDQGAFNAALIGTGQFVLDKGNVFEAQVISNNQVRVLDGELMMQGRFVRLDPDTYVDLTIENGAQGMKRNDLIIARYTKNSITGVEECNLVVIKGTAVASNPVDPEYTEGDITEGVAVLHDYPLWRIPIDGLNVGTPESMFGIPFMDSMRTLPEIRAMVKQIHSEVDAQLAEQDEEIDEKIAGLVSYTKEETLTNETKTMFGLPNGAVPNDVFAWLGKYNQYWWRRRLPLSALDPVVGDLITLTSYSEVNNYGGVNVALVKTESTSTDVTIQVASEVRATDEGGLELVNPETITTRYSYYNTLDVTKFQGKYFTSQGGTILYASPEATVQNYNGSSYNYVWLSPIARVNVPTQGAFEYLNAGDRNAYPDSGISGEYQYEFLGVPFDNAVNALKVVTGSYVGTGQATSDYPNKLTFNICPLMVIICSTNSADDKSGLSVLMRGSAFHSFVDGSEGATGEATFGTNSVEWFAEYKDYGNYGAGVSSDEGGYQMNASGVVYNYIAFGYGVE